MLQKQIIVHSFDLFSQVITSESVRHGVFGDVHGFSVRLVGGVNEIDVGFFSNRTEATECAGRLSKCIGIPVKQDN